MGVLNNEVFETIITGEYRNDDGKRINGAYTIHINNYFDKGPGCFSSLH